MIEVLVVDDDALIRGLLAEWLGEAGYRVRQAQNGAIALQMLRTLPASVMITDVEMPGRDGVQTLDEARRMLPGLRVIAISGSSRDGKYDWVAKALTLGAANAMAKPIARQDLLAAVAQTLSPQSAGACLRE